MTKVDWEEYEKEMEQYLRSEKHTAMGMHVLGIAAGIVLWLIITFTIIKILGA